MPNHKRKVLIIGLDGIRSDAIQIANTPNIDRLIRDGIYCRTAITETRTTSGAAWTSLLTGVHHQKHKVLENDFNSRDFKYKTIVKILKDWDPSLKTVAHRNWEPILKYIFEPDILDESSTGDDNEMTYRLIQAIERGSYDIHFVQLDDCDAAGHCYSFSIKSQEYLEVVERTDEHVGMIIDVVEKRPKKEDWMIITISDHGGYDNDHGMDNIDCMQILWIISGKSVPKKKEIVFNYNMGLKTGDKQEKQPHIVDMVPTIAKYFGYPDQNYWDGTARI